MANPINFFKNLDRMRRQAKLPEWYLMTTTRAKSILGKDAKQLSRSAKIANTTVEELLIDAQTRMRWQRVPKKDQAAIKMFAMFDQPGGRQRVIEAMDDLDRHYASKGYGQI